MDNLLVYTFTYLGSTIFFTFTKFGIIAATVQTMNSSTALIVCQYGIGTSLTTASLFSVATSTPFLYLCYRTVRSISSVMKPMKKNHTD